MSKKSVFNGELGQRFGYRKLTIGLCSVVLGSFLLTANNQQTVKADTVSNVEKSSIVQENKTQDGSTANTPDSSTTKANITPTKTKETNTGLVVTTEPKTNTTSNGVTTNTADSAISTETKPTKANSTLANSNIVSAQAKSAKAELKVQPKVGATSTKIKLQETKLAKSSDANNAVVVNTSDQSKSEDSNAIAPTSEDSKDIEVKPKESSNVDMNAQKEKDVTLTTNSPASETNASSKLVQTVSPEQPAAPATPVTNKTSHESNSQAQPSSSIDNTQTKLVHRPVMRLAVATATNNDELIVGKDVTISDFSVTAAKGKNEFENSHANIKFTMHADDPSTLVGKRLTIQLDNKVWNGIDYSETRKINPTTISYQGQVIGTVDYGSPSYIARITFNNHVKDYTKISVQPDLVVSGYFRNNLPYEDYLYTPTQAKDGQTYHLTNDIVIGQQKYSSNLPSTIHYRKLGSDSISSVTNLTTTSYARYDRELYAGTFYKTPDGIYYSQSSYYSGNNLYGTKSGQPGYLEGPDLYVGTDIITDHTQSYTATIDIDQTKLSLDYYSKTKPIASYYLTKNYWDDKNLLPNTSDVYIDSSHTYSSTATADATVTKNSVIFNKLNGQSLSTRRFNIDDPTYHISFGRYTNYINQNGKLHFTPALFKQLQAAAESDQNLTEAINTVKTTGMATKIKLVNPINTGLKATITTSDGKTKEVTLLIDTIGYEITTASAAPKGAILVSAQGKTAKVYHPGDQNIPAVVDQSQLTKTITRTINVHEPGKSVTTTKQTVTLTQSVSVVDGKDVTYNGDWKVQSDSYWASYDVPSVLGYTASQSNVAQQAVTDTTKDQIVNITYSANEAHQRIHYVDENGNDLVDPKDASGNDVEDGTATGVTDETVSVPVPDGWNLVDSRDATTKLVNPDTNGEVATKTVKIKHGTVVVEHTNPHNNNDLVDPNKPEGTRYDGVTDQDLNQDAIRKFIFHLPVNTKAENYAHTFTQTAQTKVTFDVNANTVTVTQTVDFYRDAIVDKITGKVVGYKAKDGTIVKLNTEHDHGWIPADDKSNGRFEAITFKQIKGYTPKVRATSPKKSVNMMVKPALFRTAMLYNISFLANATFEKPDKKEIPEKADNQDVIPSNKTTGKNTKPAKYVPENPIQNGKGNPVKTTNNKGTSSDLPQKLETKPDDKNNGDNTSPVIPSGNSDSTPLTPVDNTSKSDDTQKQKTEQKTDKQKTVDNTGKTPTKKNVKKHSKKSVKKGVKKTAKATENAPSVTTTIATTVATPVSNAKAHKVVSTNATVKAPETKSGENKLPQTGNKDDYAIMALGLANIATSLALVGAKKRKRS